MQQLEQALRPHFRNIWLQVKRPILAQWHPRALELYEKVAASAYKPDELIDVLHAQRILYIAVPKAACSRIRATLSALIGRDPVSVGKIHDRGVSGLRAPRHSVVDFHEVVEDPDALRFTFVRNPYDRILSCWANQYRGKPLVPGDRYVGLYLRHKREMGLSLPEGPGETISFADFVEVVAANAARRVDMHWQLQSDILDVPGVTLNHIGKIELFSQDFARVLDHAGVKGELRRSAAQPIHSSDHGHMSEYFTEALAARVYRAYERDFETFKYSKKLS
jgi:hypothetical protein